jgi:hypothetical protein
MFEERRRELVAEKGVLIPMVLAGTVLMGDHGLPHNPAG